MAFLQWEACMSRSTKWLIGVAGLAFWALLLGFVLFANQVTRQPRQQTVHTDGIVVFTGEGIRIKEAARLLKEGRADKLLISGVNPKIKANQLGHLTGLTIEQFDCCVTLGYQAVNTLGNATETLDWANAHNLKSLIVVTASYHMPRAMAELSLAMPDTDLVPHDVLPSRFQKHTWWLHPDVTLVLLSEYLKFLPAAARVGAVAIAQVWNGKPTAHASMSPS